MDELAETNEDVVVQKVDVDKEQQMANEYSVRTLPTLVIEGPEGPITRFNGITQAGDLMDAVESAK